MSRSRADKVHVSSGVNPVAARRVFAESVLVNRRAFHRNVSSRFNAVLGVAIDDGVVNSDVGVRFDSGLAVVRNIARSYADGAISAVSFSNEFAFDAVVAGAGADKLIPGSPRNKRVVAAVK